MEEEKALRLRVEQALDAVIAKMVVEEVLRRLAEAPFDCLVLFNGSPRGMESALASLGCLKGAGKLRLRTAWTPGASRLFSADRIAHALGSRPLAVQEPAFAESMQTADLIVLPTLTLSTAAKLAVCIRDSETTRLLSDAIIGGKRLLAATDGVLPQGENVPAAYRKKAGQHLAQLAEYGVALTAAGRIGEEALRIAQSHTAPAAAPAQRLDDRIITQASLRGIAQNARISIRPDAVVTPFARDAVRAHGITLQRE